MTPKSEAVFLTMLLSGPWAGLADEEDVSCLCTVYRSGSGISFPFSHPDDPDHPSHCSSQFFVANVVLPRADYGRARPGAYKLPTWPHMIVTMYRYILSSAGDTSTIHHSLCMHAWMTQAG